MSDLQIVTGISILVSGYAQLRCGLSTYHWQVMVLLAWFSSLTHMSCLTFLRNFLYNHPGQRIWRLLGMLSIAIMLFVAMLPTYNFNFPTPNFNISDTVHPTPSDQTICYFKPGSGHAGGERAVASMILLVVGFLFRTIRLHKSATLMFLGHWTKTVHSFAIRRLEIIYNWCDVVNHPWSPKRTLLYWPLLSIQWTVQVALDFLTSMYFEVRQVSLSVE
jgi:hypothetical protein